MPFSLSEDSFKWSTSETSLVIRSHSADLRKYEKILPAMVLVVTLSISLTAVSFLHKFTYGLNVCPPEGEEPLVTGTKYGFPLGWYHELRYDSHIEETRFISAAFIIDTITYLIVFSLMVRFFLWLYRLYTSKSQNKIPKSIKTE